MMQEETVTEPSQEFNDSVADDDASSAVEQDARKSGWVSLDDWVAAGNDPQKHRSAEEFVRVGESSSGILSKKLTAAQAELNRVRTEMDQLKRMNSAILEKVKGYDKFALDMEIGTNMERLKAAKDADEYYKLVERHTELKAKAALAEKEGQTELEKMNYEKHVHDISDRMERAYKNYARINDKLQDPEFYEITTKSIAPNVNAILQGHISPEDAVADAITAAMQEKTRHKAAVVPPSSQTMTPKFRSADGKFSSEKGFSDLPKDVQDRFLNNYAGANVSKDALEKAKARYAELRFGKK